MSGRNGSELSVYACLTGLALLLVWLVLRLTHSVVPAQLPALIAAVAGFEMAMCGHGLWRRWAGGR